MLTTFTTFYEKVCSIEHLKQDTNVEDLMGSPKKFSKPLRCAILTKSELKKTKNPNGQRSFSMTLCDQTPSSTIRAVCFEEKYYETLVPMKTYIISNFKIKKGLPANTIQIHMDTNSNIEESSTQFKIEKCNFNIAQILRREASNVNMVSVTCKVTDIDDIKTVGKQAIQKRDVFCTDGTGSIILVLWRDRAESFSFAKNDVISIENAITSTYNNVINLSTTSQTVIKTIQDERLQNVTSNLPCPIAQEEIISLNTKILMMKDFKQAVTCKNCKNVIPLSPAEDVEDGIECKVCWTTFLLEETKLTMECSLCLKDIEVGWLTARTGVRLKFSLNFIFVILIATINTVSEFTD